MRWHRHRQEKDRSSGHHGSADADGEVEVRAYGTTVPQLSQLKAWLLQKGCTSVAMESTGSYWVPVKNIPEGTVALTLINARTHRPLAWDKTDLKDARHLAHLHRHGLLKGSFLPSRQEVAEQFVEREESDLESSGNRQCEDRKHSERCVWRVRQAMVHALMEDEKLLPEQMANFAQKRLRLRIDELTEAVQGHQMTTPSLTDPAKCRTCSFVGQAIRGVGRANPEEAEAISTRERVA
jgi:transposase